MIEQAKFGATPLYACCQHDASPCDVIVSWVKGQNGRLHSQCRVRYDDFRFPIAEAATTKVSVSFRMQQVVQLGVDQINLTEQFSFLTIYNVFMASVIKNANSGVFRVIDHGR